MSLIYIFLKHCWQRLFPYWSQHERNNWYVFMFWTNSGNPKPILVLRVFNMNMWRKNVLKVMNRTTVLAHGCKNEKLTQVLSCLSIQLVCLAASKDFFLRIFLILEEKKPINVTFLLNGPHLKWKLLEKKGAFKAIEERRLISAELRTS